MKTKLSFATCPGVSLCGFVQPTLALLLYFLIGSSSCLQAQTQWYLRHPLPSPNSLLGATYGNGQFVAVGYFGTVLTSPDAVTWTSRLPERDGVLEDVAFGSGKFVAVRNDILGSLGATTVLTSTKGTVWTEGALPNGLYLQRLVFAKDLFVGFGSADAGSVPVIVTSPDAMTWTERWRGTAGLGWLSSSYPLGPNVAVGNETIVVNIVLADGSASFLVSTNGLSWVETQTALPSGSVNSFHFSFGSGKFIAVVSEAHTTGNSILKVLLSADGFAWESLTLRENWQGEVYALSFGNASFVILAGVYSNDFSGGQVVLPTALTSTDGRTWTEQSWNGPRFGYGRASKLLYAQNTFVQVGRPPGDVQYDDTHSASIFTSPDGVNWTRRVGATVNSIRGAAGDRGLVAIAPFDNNSAVLLASTNGTEWRETPELDGQNLSSIVYGNGLFVTSGGTGISTSPDGATWTRQTNAGGGWSRLRYGINGFLALGGDLCTDGIFRPNFGRSSDGLVWTSQCVSNKFISRLVDAATDGKSIVVIANEWNPQPPGGFIPLILHSVDGASWVEVFRGPAPWPELVAFGNGRYVALGSDGYGVLISGDGINWTNPAGFRDGQFATSDLIFANGRFFAVEWGNGAEARVFSSTDGVQWTAHPMGFHPRLRSLAAGLQGLFAFGSGGVILHSPWDLVLTAPERALNGTMRIYVTGPPGANVQLQRGATLIDWADWRTVTLSDAPVQLEDADVAGSSQRFYRAVRR
jgi:hypothetical protein